jgi:PA domain
LTALKEIAMTADRHTRLRRFARGSCAALVATVAATVALAAAQAATISVINTDEPGIGFNDPTPVQPVGGNPGTTLGEQRLALFQFVADFWGQQLSSDVPIQVLASFAPLECSSTNAVLGSAGAYNLFRDFPNAPRSATWYPSALANKLAGSPLSADPDPMQSADIFAVFNGDLGRPGCLDGFSFYLGFDNNEAAGQIDLLTTALHEFGHGLGFATFTDESTGNFTSGFPSIWDYSLLDPQLGKTWAEMTPDERVQSAITPRNLVWNGSNVTSAAPSVLASGAPELRVFGGAASKRFMMAPAQFGPAIGKRGRVSAPLAALVDQADGSGLACAPLSPDNAAKMRDRVALIDRGSCAFTDKVKHAQSAGAKAVVIVDNKPGTPLPLTGEDKSIGIPAVRISKADGAAIREQLATRPDTARAPFAALYANAARLVGADDQGRVFLFTPDPVRPGSSVSHYDVLATPNLLMEPAISSDLSLAVSAPNDLTLELLRDIGW